MIHFFKHLYSLYKHRKLRSKKQKKDAIIITGRNNKVFVIENGVERQIKSKERIPGIRIYITGNNNVVKLEKPLSASNVNISIYSDSTDFYMGGNGYVNNVSFIFQFGVNQVCKIGKNCTFEQAEIVFNSNGCGIIVGDDCMFSNDIHIWCSDGHTIVDKDTGNILNNVKGPIIIGNHCWICQGVRITKNARIHDNCIIGNAAVVYKDYVENNVVISGNPATIIKRGVTWRREHN